MKRKQTAAAGGRRSFFLKLGAGASAALASTVGLAEGEVDGAKGLALKIALLEEEKELRKLHQAFERALDEGRYDDVIELFSDDAAVVFNGGEFKARAGIGRLFRQRFRAGRSGKRIAPAPGFDLAPEERPETVAIAPDLGSAEAELPYSIQVGEPVASETSLASMARLHGEGVRSWWEGGIYKVSYRRGADGRWQIRRLVYATRVRADYRPGRTHAGPIAVAPLALRYPEDPAGPDALI